jgi:hypothetical protein
MTLSFNEKLKLYYQVSHDFTIKKIYHPVREFRVARGMGNHDNGGAFLVELAEQVHDFNTIF